jgi:hypothetical protein
MELRPILDASGLRVLGIDYQSAELNELFHAKKHIAVSVRVDLKNLGAISVKIGSDWLLVDGPPELYKVTVKDWIEVWDEFQRRNAAVNKLTKPLLDDTIAHLTAIGKIGRDRMNIATEPMSAGEIAHHQKRMNIGVSFVPDKAAAKARPRRGLLDGALTVGGGPAEPPPEPAAAPRKRPKARKAARNVNAAKPAAATAPKTVAGAKAKRPQWDLGSKK